MKLDDSLEPFRAAIESLNRLFEKYNMRGVIIGGVAVGLLSKPRSQLILMRYSCFPRMKFQRSLNFHGLKALSHAFKILKSSQKRVVYCS